MAESPTAPVVAQKAPYAVDVQAGKTYYWCSCGLSTKQPFCDGSHKSTSLTPLAHTASKDEKLWFCGCKATGKQPFCDGRHKSL
jgi:CDGSH-type Zn-finger protein